MEGAGAGDDKKPKPKINDFGDITIEFDPSIEELAQEDNKEELIKARISELEMSKSLIENKLTDYEKFKKDVTHRGQSLKKNPELAPQPVAAQGETSGAGKEKQDANKDGACESDGYSFFYVQAQWDAMTIEELRRAVKDVKAGRASLEEMKIYIDKQISAAQNA